MKREAPYADSSVNPYAATQMQHMSAQWRQQHSGMNNFPGQPDSFPAEQGHLYISSRADGSWQVSNPLSSHTYIEGQGGNAGHSIYQGQMPESKIDPEKQANKEPRLQSHEQDMEIGYEDQLAPLTYEGLEQKFHDEIVLLIKEQSDSEDAENARHRERIMEINNQYQEKLSSLRAQQASRREEFLRKETHARLHQYQQAGMKHHLTRTGPTDPHGYSGAVPGEADRAYAAGRSDYYREQRSFLAGARGQRSEARVPYPEGRVYNNAGARYY